MTIAVDLGRKATKQTNKPTKLFYHSLSLHFHVKILSQGFISNTTLLHCITSYPCCVRNTMLVHVYQDDDPGVTSWIPARSHTFVEIDHEIISTVILLPSAVSFKKGCCQLQAKVCSQITG